MELFVIGLILIGIGVFLIFKRKKKAYELTSFMIAREAKISDLKSEFSEVSDGLGQGLYKQLIAMHGTIETDQPLRAELSKRDCVKYRTVVERNWEEDYQERDNRGYLVERTRQGSDIVSQQEQALPFYINDGSGTIRVSPDGADIDLEKVVERYEPVRNRNFGGDISIGGLNFNLFDGLSSQRRLLGYRYREWILPVGRRVFIHGEVSDSGGELTFQMPSDPEKEEPYTISLKSKSELIRKTQQQIKLMKVWSIILIIVGGLLVLFSVG